MLTSHDASPTPDARRLPAPDRTSSVTPLEVRQARFASAMRGFDRAEVTAFLLEAAEGFEQALRENERTRQDVLRLEASLQQYRELEGSLRNAVMSAQKLADDMRETAAQDAARMRDAAAQDAARLREQAAQEAALLVREAQGQADLLLQRANASVEDSQREVDALRMKRRDAESGVEAIIASLHNTLDFVREQDERPHRVIALRPRLEATA
jgi:cell division initiation protein